MLIRLKTILAREVPLALDKPIIVGVSGGPDSLCLGDVLCNLGYSLVVAHFNHLLRPNAGKDAQTVELIAAKMKVPFVLGVGSAMEYASDNGLSVEEAARELRYRFLFEQARSYGAQAVAVAHHADDQVETVLMHLLRGAGLDGLTGMSYRSLPNPWSETIPLVRPLLGAWRAELLAYCAERDLTPVTDPSNADTAYFRNRLRHELVPELETYIPGFRLRLWQTADLLNAERALLDELTDKAWLDLVEKSGTGYLSLQLRALQLQPLGLQRRLIRKAISQLRPGARDVDFAMIQRVIEFATNPALTGHADLGLGLQMAIEGNSLLISEGRDVLPTDQWPQITDPNSLPIPGELKLNAGWILKAEICPNVALAFQEAQRNRVPFKAWIDLGDRQPLLKVRPRRPGERFQPLGMDGQSLKISDFMVNQKIPQRARAGWPLVCVEDEIVWVPGYRLGHDFRLTKGSNSIVELLLHHQSGHIGAK